MMSGLADSQFQDLNNIIEKHYCGNHQLTAQEVAEEVGISIGSCHTTLT